MLAGAAHADLFTIQRSSPTPTITGTGTGGDILVTFTNLGTESPQAESNPPGTSLTLMNYTVTTTGAPVGPVAIDQTFTLNVLFTDYSYAGNPVHNSVFNGHVSGFATATQDNLVIDLTPANPDTMSFDINYTHFELSNLMKTLPPIVNDTANPGAVSALIVSRPIPEPGSMALLSVGLLPAIGLLRRRR
jgi:hypothetical protein